MSDLLGCPERRASLQRILQFTCGVALDALLCQLEFSLRIDTVQPVSNGFDLGHRDITQTP